MFLSGIGLAKRGNMFKAIVAFVLSACIGLTIACVGSFGVIPWVDTINTNERIVHTSVTLTVFIFALYLFVLLLVWLYKHFYSSGKAYYASRQSGSS